MVKRRLYAVFAAGALVSACSFAPTYQPPHIDTPTAYKETDHWALAKPADHIPRDGWWKIYRDPILNGLETQIATANPTVAAALARHDEALAYLAQQNAGLYPTVGVEAQTLRERQSANKPPGGPSGPLDYNDNIAGVGLSYDLDLWGKVRNEVAAGQAQAQASEADLASVQLSLQASLANAYFGLRDADEQARLLVATSNTYQRALTLTVSRHQAGAASAIDVSQAQTQLASAQAAVEDIQARRALLEHSIATLIGVPASQFTLQPKIEQPYVPFIPPGVPATLLQRRPDIAAAERRVAAANAQIGVAKAAYFPDISLAIQGGFESGAFAPWLIAPNEVWSIGPTLMQTLFDGGKRRAITDQARAQLAENGAQYKATVLQAFQQVEDNLALEHHLGNEAVLQSQALATAKHTLQLSMSRYEDGVASYLEVVNAQTTELQTQIAVVKLHTEQMQASVGLIEALGGGWDNLSLTNTDSKSKTAGTVSSAKTPSSAITQ